jgi:hypothetical protein
MERVTEVSDMMTTTNANTLVIVFCAEPRDSSLVDESINPDLR